MTVSEGARNDNKKGCNDIRKVAMTSRPLHHREAYPSFLSLRGTSLFFVIGGTPLFCHCEAQSAKAISLHLLVQRYSIYQTDDHKSYRMAR